MPVWPAFQGNLGLSRQCSETKCELGRTGWPGIVIGVPTAEPSPRHFPREGSCVPCLAPGSQHRISGSVGLWNSGSVFLSLFPWLCPALPSRLSRQQRVSIDATTGLWLLFLSFIVFEGGAGVGL